MADEEKCGVRIVEGLDDSQPLTCELPPGHEGERHESSAVLRATIGALRAELAEAVIKLPDMIRGVTPAAYMEDQDTIRGLRSELEHLRETHYAGPPDIELEAAKEKLPNWCPVVPLHDEDGTIDCQDRDDGHSHHYVPSTRLADVREQLADANGHLAAIKITVAQTNKTVDAYREELRSATDWEDRSPDEWSEAIEAAFPTNSGSHETYATAMKMVGNRHSKGSLVALVNWLLVELDAAKGKTNA